MTSRFKTAKWVNPYDWSGNIAAEHIETGGYKVTNIIGVDPGNTGCYCVTDCAEESPTVLHIDKSPIIKIPKKGKGYSNYLNTKLLYDLFASYYPRGSVAVVEEVGGIPGQSASASFNFGSNFGSWIGLFVSLRIPVLLVRPQEWKSAFSLLKSPKSAAKPAAKVLSGGLELSIDKAEAYLIARYGYEKVSAILRKAPY